MKIHSFKCICDRCNKEITEWQHDNNRIILYTNKNIYGTVRHKEVYLCNDCLKEVFKFAKTFLKLEDKDDENY